MSFIVEVNFRLYVKFFDTYFISLFNLLVKYSLAGVNGTFKLLLHCR